MESRFFVGAEIMITDTDGIIESESQLECQHQSAGAAPIEWIDIGAVSNEAWMQSGPVHPLVDSYFVGRLLNSLNWLLSRAAITGTSGEISGPMQEDYEVKCNGEVTLVLKDRRKVLREAGLHHPHAEVDILLRTLTAISFRFEQSIDRSEIRKAIAEDWRDWCRWFGSNEYENWIIGLEDPEVFPIDCSIDFFSFSSLSFFISAPDDWL